MNAWLEARTGLVLLEPWMLLVGLLVPVALLWRWRRGAARILFAPGSLAGPDRDTGRPLTTTWRVRLLPLPSVLVALGLLSVAVALARPAVRTPIPEPIRGVDILLCLDTSSSMAANDLDPERTRLDLAKDAAARFVAGRPHDRIGLVAFARYPDVRCPLTLDHRALQESLAAVTRVEPEGPEDATGIGTAVARAAQVLEAGENESRIVILLTDGDENVATAQTPDEIAPLHAGQLCETLGVRLHVVVAGLGDRSPTGEWVALDTRQIQELAERTGGVLFEARDANAVAGVYAAIDSLEKTERQEPRYRIEDRFPLFLLFALAAFVVARLLSATLLEVLP